MPSPFPGMDPFLEEPAIWPTIHPGLISFLWMELNHHLPAGYVATVVEPPTSRHPDGHVSKHAHKGKKTNGTVAVIEGDPSLEIEFPPRIFANRSLRSISRAIGAHSSRCWKS
ncbi:MAG TPA: DUF4058 family protein [Gemmataceae bacterium]|nr:DUF4058 family protein [Gemmataceae bacterium]